VNSERKQVRAPFFTPALPQSHSFRSALLISITVFFRLLHYLLFTPHSLPLNYFEYFSEIEQLFSRRRGSVLLLSTLDWALIETWREAGIPLAAVLRGIDNAFDKHDAQRLRARGRLRKVNGLAWCAQAVMQAAEELVEASTGLPANGPKEAASSGLENERIAAYLERNAQTVAAAVLSASASAAAEAMQTSAAEAMQTAARRLHELAAAMRSASPPALEDLDRTLTVLEERLVEALRAATPEPELVALREASDRELAPYRGKMGAAQLKQVVAQLEAKRLLERAGAPRLSIFYMGMGE
jgi:hypothetical protein